MPVCFSAMRSTVTGIISDGVKGQQKESEISVADTSLV